MVTNRVLRALIRGCLYQDPQERPTMEGIIGELDKLVKDRLDRICSIIFQ